MNSTASLVDRVFQTRLSCPPVAITLNWKSSDMTHDELIAMARKHLKAFGDLGEHGVALERLAKARVRDAAVVDPEGDEHDGKLEVYLERESGEFLTATLIPPREK